MKKDKTLDDPWVPPSDLGKMTILQLCDEITRLRAEVKRWEYLADTAWAKADAATNELFQLRYGALKR